MKLLNLLKVMLLIIIVSIIMSGCSYKLKPVGINETIPTQSIDSLAALGMKYQPTFSFIGQIDLTDENIVILNKSIAELYDEVKKLDTHEVIKKSKLRDTCKQNGIATNYNALKFKENMEYACRRMSKNNGYVADYVDIGFKVERLRYPSSYSVKLKNMKTGGKYEKNKPLKTGVKSTIQLTNYQLMFQHKKRGSYRVKNSPASAHFSFIPLDDKLHIVLNFTLADDPTLIIDNLLHSNNKEGLDKFVDIKNNFYKILEKNGLKINYDEEIGTSEYDILKRLRGIHKKLNNKI